MDERGVGRGYRLCVEEVGRVELLVMFGVLRVREGRREGRREITVSGLF